MPPAHLLKKQPTTVDGLPNMVGRTCHAFAHMPVEDVCGSLTSPASPFPHRTFRTRDGAVNAGGSYSSKSRPQYLVEVTITVTRVLKELPHASKPSVEEGIERTADAEALVQFDRATRTKPERGGKTPVARDRTPGLFAGAGKTGGGGGPRVDDSVDLYGAVSNPLSKPKKRR